MPYRRLLPHQRIGLRWACRVPDQRLPILWDMRLGKTLLTVRWIERMEHLPALIVAPLSVLPTWERELLAEGWPPLKIANLNDKRERELSFAEGLEAVEAWYLINYEALRLNPWIADQPWKAVVLDESVTIKNPQAKITKLCTSAFSHVPARAILSGYPTPNKMSEIFSQMQFLYGGFLGHRNFWTFRKEYYRTHFSGFGWQPKPGTLETIQKEVHEAGLVLRRKDVNLGSAVVTQPRYAPLPPALAREYRKMERDFASSDGRTTKWKVVINNWLRQLCGGPHKDKLLFELLDDELAEEKAVVWFTYTKDLLRVRQMLKKRRRPFCEFHGGTSLSERKAALRKFERPGATVMLANPAAARYGTDWSVADTAIYYSLDYNPDLYEQSKNRIIHPNKKTPVLLVHLLTKDTIEEDVVEALRQKKLEGGMSMRPVWDAALARRNCLGGHQGIAH